MFEFGLVLQIVGVLIILVGQVMFWYSARREKRYGCVQKAFLDMVCAQVGFDDKELKELSKDEVKKYLKENFQLGKFLYEDFNLTSLGLAVTLIGLILSVFNI